MAWFRWRSGGEPPKETAPIVNEHDEDDEDDTDEGDSDHAIDADDASEQLMSLAQRSQPVEVTLLEARLADLLRDAGIEPLSPESFADWSRDLSDLGWQQLALCTELLAETFFSAQGEPPDEEMVPQEPAETSARGEPPDRPLLSSADLYAALRAPIDGSAAVSIELLATSPVRAEEFVRRMAMALGVPIWGESAKMSRHELEKLDYNVLLARVNDAKLSAEERMARLRALQESQDALRRRGKW